MSTAVVILAAGKGTRMNSEMPKVLHTLAEAPLLAHVMETADGIGTERCVLVTGAGSDQVTHTARSINPNVETVHQGEQLGTGHAVLQAKSTLEDFSGNTIVLYGDTPLIRPETLTAMLAARDEGADIVVLGFEAEDPTGYGRLITDAEGSLEAIIEENEASSSEKSVRLCNSGVVAVDNAVLFSLLEAVGNDNAKGEYYLTDIVGIARNRGLAARAITCPEHETLGVNSRSDLAAAEAAFQSRARAGAMSNGVTLTDPLTVWFARDTVIGRDVSIGPNVFFGPNVTIESGATVSAFCHLEGCHISVGAKVGPFARLRPGAELAENTRIGNFVEIKNATIDEGAKVNHLSYIGDARLGRATNIGAGTITCNYDGVFKHRTEIGERVFIGSNSALVAPVTVGDDALVGAGSVINEDVPEGALAIGRSRQTNKPGLGERLMTMLRARRPGGTKH